MRCRLEARLQYFGTSMVVSIPYNFHNHRFEAEVSGEMQDCCLAFAEDPVGGLPAVGWHGDAGSLEGKSALFEWRDGAVRSILDKKLESGCDEGVLNGGPNPPTA